MKDVVNVMEVRRRAFRQGTAPPRYRWAGEPWSFGPVVTAEDRRIARRIRERIRRWRAGRG